jgi:hypothetical protein
MGCESESLTKCVSDLKGVFAKVDLPPAFLATYYTGEEGDLLSESRRLSFFFSFFFLVYEWI